MANKTYGKRIKSYEVVKKKNGCIELLVYHKNEEIREYLKRHENKPQYFLERRDQYMKNNLTAKKWLAQVIDDYRSYFEKGQVKVVFKKPRS